MERPIISFTGFPPNGDKAEIKKYIEETVLPMPCQKNREEIHGGPLGPGRFLEPMEHKGRWIKVSPKLDWRGAQKKVQRTRAIKAAEALSPGAEPKLDFECGMVWISDKSTSTRPGRGWTMSTGLRERSVCSHPSITFVSWNTHGSVDADIAVLLVRMSQVSSWSFVAGERSETEQNWVATDCCTDHPL